METTAPAPAHDFTEDSDADLRAAYNELYAKAISLFDEASAIHAEMAKTAPWTAAYQEMKPRAADLMARARCAKGAHDAVAAEIRARRGA